MGENTGRNKDLHSRVRCSISFLAVFIASLHLHPPHRFRRALPRDEKLFPHFQPHFPPRYGFFSNTSCLSLGPFQRIMSISKGSFLIDDILADPKSPPPLVGKSGNSCEFPSTGVRNKYSWDVAFHSSFSQPDLQIGSPAVSSRDFNFEAAGDSTVTTAQSESRNDAYNQQMCTKVETNVTTVGPALTIAVPIPLNTGHLSQYSYHHEHAKPLNLAAKARLTDDDTSVLSPSGSLPRLPLNVPAYFPKLKGK